MLHGMGLIQLYSTPKTNASASDPSQATSRCHDENPSFCRCQRTEAPRKPIEKPKTKCQMNLSGNALPDQVARKVYLDAPKSDKINLQIPPDTCRCGEDTCQIINWTWDRQNVQPQTLINDHTVQFHPIFSQGTSVIRSDQPLAPNMIHYWEVKIVHWLSGTDLVSNQLHVFSLFKPISNVTLHLIRFNLICVCVCVPVTFIISFILRRVNVSCRKAII